MKYIALLRGINVGGKNKLSMPELKAAFEKHGFTGVYTYISSGNILFESDESCIIDLKGQCQNIIKAGFSLDIAVAVISANTFADALAHAPEWWGHDGHSKHNAIFVLPPVTAEQLCAEVGEIKPEYERMAYYGPVIFWSAPIKTFSHTRWQKVVGTPSYGSITIRNANTALKLAKLVSGLE